MLVRFHTALFASEPEIVNTTTRVLKVIHSLVHPFNCTRVHLLSPHRVWLLYSHLAKRSAPKGETNVSSIQSNQTRQVWIFFALIPHLFIRYENCVWKKIMKTPCKLFNIETGPFTWFVQRFFSVFRKGSMVFFLLPYRFIITNNTLLFLLFHLADSEFAFLFSHVLILVTIMNFLTCPVQQKREATPSSNRSTCVPYRCLRLCFVFVGFSVLWLEIFTASSAVQVPIVRLFCWQSARSAV